MRIQLNYDLGAQNTFRMKVSCACYVEYENVKELEGLNFDRLPKPLLHIGEGSNLLFTGDFPGTVLHSNIEFIKYIDMGFDDVPVMVGAGVEWDHFVAETCRHGLWGAENLSLIPGEVGAAAVQNIGAYGVEVKDIISGVVAFDLQERKKVKFSREECRYGYRDSLFKQPGSKGRYVVTSVLLRLSRKPGSAPGLQGNPRGAGRPRAAEPAGSARSRDPHPAAETARPGRTRQRRQLLQEPGREPGGIRAHLARRQRPALRSAGRHGQGPGGVDDRPLRLQGSHGRRRGGL